MMTRRGETCQVCGYNSQLGAVARHHLIPTEITEQAGRPMSEMVSLCCNCHHELHTWCRMKIADMVYDPDNKRFRARTWDEQVRDYQYAFSSFTKYKQPPENK